MFARNPQWSSSNKSSYITASMISLPIEKNSKYCELHHQVISCLTLMKSTACESFKFGKVVHKVAVLIFGVWCHVMKLTDISLPDAQGEDLYTTPAKHCCYWPRIPAIRVAVCDEEDDFCSILTCIPQNLLQKYVQVNN